MIKDISGVESKNNDEEIEEIIKIVDFNNVIEGKNEKFSKKLFKLGNKLKYYDIFKYYYDNNNNDENDNIKLYINNNVSEIKKRF